MTLTVVDNLDLDSDSIANPLDDCPTVANPDQIDTDADGIGNACECLDVVCSATDQCHAVGVCAAETGVCSNPATDDGTACDDGNACTIDDACVIGVCAGAAIPVPADVAGVTASDRTTFSWSAAAFASQYDVVRGSLGTLPVGSGGADEVCFDNLAGISLNDEAVPSSATGFWYVLRGDNSCSTGSYGTQSNGSSRVTMTCP